MFRIKLIVLVVGCVLVYFGVQEARLSSTTKSQPQPISLAQLASNGPGDNAHVEIRDFLCSPSFIYESKEGSNKWTCCWVPAVSLDSEYAAQLNAMLVANNGVLPNSFPDPKSFNVILKMPDVESERDFERIAAQDTAQGVVINLIEGLGGEEKKILKQSFPGVDLDACYIVEIGRQPSGVAKTAGLIGGGGLLGVLGLAWLGSGLFGQRATPAA